MIGSFIGGIAFLLMAWAIVLATRLRRLEAIFGGLDRMYRVHKFIGVSVLILILLHFFASLELTESSPPEGLADLTDIPSTLIGIISLILLVLSIVISLNRKFPYHIWFNFHRVIGILFFVVTFHMLLSPPQIFNGRSASGTFLLLVAIIGISAFIYRQIARHKNQVSYQLMKVNHLGRATELVLSPATSASIKFKPGQLGFLKLDHKGFQESHPFTISSAPLENSLRFTIKALGDFTRRVRTELKPGVTASIEEPYGCFDLNTKNRNQVWGSPVALA